MNKTLMSDEEKKKILSSLCLMDDVFFSKCFSESNECTSLLLRIILSRSDITEEEVRTQQWEHSILSRSARLDILARDKDGKIFNIEIQKDRRGAKRKRARYYSSMIDVSALAKGEDYDTLPESYVIFITEQDALGDGQALYEIERCIAGTGKPYGDGSHIIHVSASLTDSDTELGNLMADLRCTDPDAMHYNELRDRVRFLKRSNEGVISMSGEFEKIIERAVRISEKEALEKGEKRGEKRGVKRGKTDMVKTMIADGSVPLEKIAQFSGLTVAEVESLKQSMVQ